ncbi:hypothetical protein NAP1_14568 [Erythrobacter sp. NAP1]|uniref:YdcH family protein n=1 Tax=Erythrobacter sp. NAP1 TaxID=237727 RepID=UPI0000687851|nr:DUF465 domain-containing protein [Erythrobacter sp. NAP1]EAQ28831.1 hypothetical protein NAP1_14568 [Erythrobacter sp. NAP1]
MSAHTPHELHEEFPHDAAMLTRLKLTDNHFCNLAGRYHALNRSIHRIEVEIECSSDAYLTRLKKQRLMLLDEIAALIEDAESKLVETQATPTPAAARLFGRNGDPITA